MALRVGRGGDKAVGSQQTSSGQLKASGCQGQGWEGDAITPEMTFVCCPA